MIQNRDNLGITILGSGSRGNAMVLHSPTGSLLIDAGFSARQMRMRMQLAGIDEKTVSAILISHEHRDHIAGLRVTAKQLKAEIYVNSRTGEALKYKEPKLGQLNIFSVGSPFDIGEFRIEPFSIPHDANDPVGFTVQWNGRKVGIATDLGHASHLVAFQLRECDLLVLESNHDIPLLRESGRPWSLKQRILSRHGHLSNGDSMSLLKQVIHQRTRSVVLAHVSEECNQYALVEKCATACLAEIERDDIKAVVATQHDVLPTLWV